MVLDVKIIDSRALGATMDPVRVDFGAEGARIDDFDVKKHEVLKKLAPKAPTPKASDHEVVRPRSGPTPKASDDEVVRSKSRIRRYSDVVRR